MARTEGAQSTAPPTVRGGDVDGFIDRCRFPLVVVTAISEDEELSGCLAGFTTQCSIDPLRYLVCLSKANHTYRVALAGWVLALHLLGADQGSTARHFGERSGDDIDKFASIDWHRGPAGVPVLDHCAAWCAVDITARFDVGDHVAHVTRPIDGGTGMFQDLLTNGNAPPLDAGHPA